MNFTEDLEKVLEMAKGMATHHNHNNYSAAHLLKASLHRQFHLLKDLEALDIDVYFMEEWAEVRIEDLEKSMTPHVPEADQSIEAILEEADNISQLLDQKSIDLFSTMVAMATPGVGFNFDEMKTFPITREELLNTRQGITESVKNLPTQRAQTNVLHKFCINQTAVMKQNPLEIVGRDEEIKEISEILCRYSKPNVLLLGYPGVGKTAVINGFIQQIIRKQVPAILLETAVFFLELDVILAGTSTKSEIETRFQLILKEVRLYGKAILVIDGLHILLDKNADNAGISTMLKSEVSKGLTLIGTTTIDEYTKKIEKDENLAGLFEVVKIEEPSDEKSFRILEQAIQRYTKHHELSIGEETIEKAVQLAKRYLKEKSLPESALTLLDRTMAIAKTTRNAILQNKESLLKRIEEIKLISNPVKQLQKTKWLHDDLRSKISYLNLSITDSEIEAVQETPEEYLNLIEKIVNQAVLVSENDNSEISEFDLLAVVAQKTGIPIGKLKSEEKERLNNMENILQKRVIGQSVALNVVSEAILESRSGLRKAGQPIASFFFLGPTGTGKTELAKSLAEFLFQDENAIIRFDMSEFKEEHSAALLYGAPPGYVGYEEGGLLVNKIRQKPYSIVLFDEIEKAHTSVFDVFLQIMDEGKLHDRLGKEGDFSNALILFTSNIGAKHIVESVEKGEGLPSSNNLLEIMAGFFRPEFLGRLTEIIPFSPITKENALSIFEIHLKKELFELTAKLNIDVEITDEAKRFLVDSGFNATYGARPLKGIIRTALRRPLARKIIAGEISDGSKLEITLADNAIQIKDKAK